LVAGFFMVFHNPNILLYDPSFQLSFLATVGLIYVSPKIEHIFRFIPKKSGMREIVGATIGTQIFILPFLVYLVGQISLVSLPVNILILPFIPITMLFGFITGMLGYVSYTLSLIFGWQRFQVFLCRYWLLVYFIFSHLHIFFIIVIFEIWK